LPPDRLNSSVGKVEVRLENLPSLIWVPRGAHWRSADVVLPEEMPEMIGPSVRFLHMTLEPAPRATLVTQIEPAPEWLVVMRRAHKTIMGLPSGQFNFTPYKIETGYQRGGA